MKIYVLAATLAVLTGCQSVPTAARPPVTPQNFCYEATLMLDDPYVSDWQKLALYEKMRNAGCMR